MVGLSSCGRSERPRACTQDGGCYSKGQRTWPAATLVTGNRRNVADVELWLAVELSAVYSEVLVP